MQKRVLMAMAASALFASTSVFADAGDWMVRVRAVHVDWINESDPVVPLAVPADGIHLENKTIPEVDISYFFPRTSRLSLF